MAHTLPWLATSQANSGKRPIDRRGCMLRRVTGWLGTSAIDARLRRVSYSAAMQASAMTAAPSATITRFGPTGHRKPRSLAANVLSGAIWSFRAQISCGCQVSGLRQLLPVFSRTDFGVFAVATTVFTIVTASANSA